MCKGLQQGILTRLHDDMGSGWSIFICYTTTMFACKSVHFFLQERQDAIIIP